MITEHFSTSENNTTLIIFFNGWGMDYNCIKHIDLQYIDLLHIHNYTHLQLDTSSISHYKTIHVVAWSMGVWVAHTVLSGTSLPIQRAVAINGTLNPINNETGIPHKIFLATLRTLSPENIVRFQKKMFGTIPPEKYKKYIPSRSFDSQKNELQWLYNTITNAPPLSYDTFTWDKAIISNDDEIFPPENMIKAWKGITHIEEVQEPHYVFDGKWINALNSIL
ncbi:MAG: pimeloyl-ACP methyl esterase BioG family protein [Bacteroidales bacterium]